MFFYDPAGNIIEVHYENAPSDGFSHSAGIENQDGTIGTQYFFGSDALNTPLAVRYEYYEDAEWLIQSPNSGTIPAGESINIDLIFDATLFEWSTIIDTYSAELRFNGTFDNIVAPIDITMQLTREGELYRLYLPVMAK